MRKKLLVLIIMVTVIGIHHIEAADDEEINEDILFREIPIVSIFSDTGKQSDVRNVPGIVDVITREDIKTCGFRTISAALQSLPGFEQVQNDDEYLMAVRGIYPTINQKFLLMRDGHILNEPNLDMCKLDYEISLESIDRIEIIRGPGASIYGNAAMVAVINIITVKSNINEASVAFGNYGQADFDAVVAKQNEEYSLTVFGRYAKTDGQPFTVPASQDASANKQAGYSTAASFPGNANFGFRYETKNLAIAVSREMHSYNIYWTQNPACGLNTNDELLVKQPNQMLELTHADINYKANLADNVSLNLNHYGDYANVDIVKNNGEITSAQPRGQTESIPWTAAKAGLNYIVNCDFGNNNDLMAGVNFEYRHLQTNGITKFTALTTTPVYFFDNGVETRGAVFAQGNYSPLKFLIINAGARYDVSEDYPASANPRLAAILKADQNWSGKLIYTTAFQTPGWSYEHSSGIPGSGVAPGDTLQTETLKTYQVSLRYDTTAKNFFTEATYYWNKFDNLIEKDSLTGYYYNSGSFGDQGFEIEAKRAFKVFAVSANYTYLTPNVSDIDLADVTAQLYGSQFRNLAQNTVKADIVYKPGKQISLDLNGMWEQGFHTILNTVETNLNYPIPDITTVNMTVTYQLAKDTDLSLSIYNLFDFQYSIGDATDFPQPQPGRWFLVKGTFKI